MKKTLITLGICATAAVFASGCASQKTRSGRETNILGGALTVKTGDYIPAPATTIHVEGDKLIGRGNPSGTQISALWGLVTYTDY